MVNITTMATLTVIINFKDLLLYIDYLFAWLSYLKSVERRKSIFSFKIILSSIFPPIWLLPLATVPVTLFQRKCWNSCSLKQGDLSYSLYLFVILHYVTYKSIEY